MTETHFWIIYTVSLLLWIALILMMLYNGDIVNGEAGGLSVIAIIPAINTLCLLGAVAFILGANLLPKLADKLWKAKYEVPEDER